MQQGYEMLDYSPKLPKRRNKYVMIAVALLLVASTTSNTPPQQMTTETTSGNNILSVQYNQQPQALSDEVTNLTNMAPITQTIHFGMDSAILLHEEVAKVEYFLAMVKDGKGTVSINGYTDNLGSHAHGIMISEQRAIKIESLLKQLGLGEQLSLAIKGNAEENPIGDNSTADGRALNRRVEIIFVPQ